MRKDFCITLTLLCLVTLFAGCDGQGIQVGDLILKLSCDTLSSTQRALSPDTQTMEIDSYHIDGTGPCGATLHIDSASNPITLGNLAIGTWNLRAKALNSKKNILAAGSSVAILSKSTATTVLTLDELEGNGSLSVGFSWDPEQVANDNNLALSLIDQEGKTIVLPALTVNKEQGSASFTLKSIPAGSYRLYAKLYSQGIAISGAVEAVRIIENNLTFGSMHMVIGDLSTTFKVTVINETMMPLEGSITCVPETPEAGEKICLTFAVENLPDGLTVKSITPTWYCEGDIIDADGFSYTCIPAPGVHRYDIIVRTENLGSIGSSTVLVSMPLK